MRLFKSALTTIALLALSVAASAQQTSTGATQGGAPAVIPKGKIAVINTDVFQEQIAEYKSKIDALNRQFEPRVKEVQSLADKINALENTIKTQSQVLGAAKVAEMTEQVDSMKKEYQRKAEDLQADAGRERDKMLEPVSAKLSKLADEYTKKRGITLLIDIGNALQSGTVVWFDSRMDITKDFISEYNKANPVAAAPATPPASVQKP